MVGTPDIKIMSSIADAAAHFLAHKTLADRESVDFNGFLFVRKISDLKSNFFSL